MKINSDKFYTVSDLHLHHYNILKYDNRPFSTLDEMHEVIISNWNKTVPSDATVFLLGDVALGGSAKAEDLADILWHLNGNIVLVKGNHDTYVLKKPCVERFKSIHKELLITVIDDDGTEQLIEMCHYPFDFDYKPQDGRILLHGHSHHNSHRGDNLNKKQLDVGINGYGYNYSPLSYGDVKRLMINGI